MELLILYFIFRKQISRPLKDFIRATYTITAGRFDVSLDLERRDELGRLADSFSTMSREVQLRENRSQLLLEGAKSMASSQHVFYALAIAARTLLRELPAKDVRVHAYRPVFFEKKGNNDAAVDSDGGIAAGVRRRAFERGG